MTETLNRQGAIDDLESMKAMLKLGEQETAFLVNLIQQAQTPEELESIIEDTAITHDPAQEEERSWPWDI